jgi:hypothetical protein
MRELMVGPVLDHEWRRIAELTARHVHLPLGVVDASVVVLAERYRTEEIATLDPRHFPVVIPDHVPAFRLLP